MREKYHYPCLHYLGKTGESNSLKTLGAARVAIYGSGGRGKAVLADLKSNHHDLEPVCFVDTHDCGEAWGLPLVNLEMLRERKQDLDMVIIASHWHREISRSLDSIGFHSYITALPARKNNLMALIHALYPVENERVVGPMEVTESDITTTILHKDASPTEYRVDIAQLKNTPGWLAHDPNAGVHLLYSEKPDKSPLVTVQFADVPVEPVCSVDHMAECDWTDEEERYANQRWGHVLDEPSQFKQAQALARLLIEEFEPNRGTPVAPDAAPYHLYREMLLGAEKVHCGVMAKIFCYFCNVLGIKSRILQLGNVPEADPGLSLSNCHWINEIYCRDLRQWCLFDLTSYAVGFFLSKENVLSLYEFLWCFSSNKKSNVHVETHIPAGVDGELNAKKIGIRYASVNQRFSIVSPPYGS